MATKVILPEAELPTHWYNIVPDLPAPPPAVLHPGTHQPVGPDDLAPLFPMDLILQEVSGERFVEIPEEIREVYRLWRPSPLYRAHGLEPRAGMAIGSTEALKRLLGDGQGVAWLSQRVIERALASGELCRLAVADLQIERELHVLWRPGSSLSPAPAAFLALSETSD